MIPILEYKLTGICLIDTAKMIRRWTLLHRIYRFRDKYTLVEMTPKGKIKMKIRISQESAENIIEQCRLIEVPSTLFNHGSVYLNV